MTTTPFPSEKIRLAAGPRYVRVSGTARGPVRKAIEQTILLLSPTDRDEPVDWRDLCSISRGMLLFPRTLLEPVCDELRIAGHPFHVEIEPKRKGSVELPSVRLDVTNASLSGFDQDFIDSFRETDRKLLVVDSVALRTYGPTAIALALPRENGPVTLLAASETRFSIESGFRMRYRVDMAVQDGDLPAEAIVPLVIGQPALAATVESGSCSAVVTAGLDPLRSDDAFRNLMYGHGATVPLFGVALKELLSVRDALRLCALFGNEVGELRPNQHFLPETQFIVLPDPSSSSRKSWSNKARNDELEFLVHCILIDTLDVVRGLTPAAEQCLKHLLGSCIVIVAESVSHCRKLRQTDGWNGSLRVITPGTACQADLSGAIVVLACPFNRSNIRFLANPAGFRGRPAAIIGFIGKESAMGVEGNRRTFAM